MSSQVSGVWPLGQCFAFTNLYYYIPRDKRVTYSDDVNDIQKRIFRTDFPTSKFIYSTSQLEDFLDSFDLPQGDSEYNAEIGEFLSLSDLFMGGCGFKVMYGNVFDAFKDDDDICGAILMVRYRHKVNPRQQFKLYFAVFSSLLLSRGVCFGRL